MNIYNKVFENLSLIKKNPDKINIIKNKIHREYNRNSTNFQSICDEYHQFFFFILNLKNIIRSGWSSKTNIKNPESVAEHTYSLCLIGMLFSDMFGFKTERVIKMALLHDLAETITGDYTPEEISPKEKVLKERTAIKKILGLLPKKIRSEYMSIWKEYTLNTTDTSRLVHNLDKFEMLLQANLYLNNGISYESLKTFFESGLDYLNNKNVPRNKISSNYAEFDKFLLKLSRKFSL